MREWLVERFWLLFLIFSFSFFFFFCPDGILDYITIRLELGAANRSIENLKEENASLRRTLSALRNNDEDLLEEYARRRGLLRDGERLCIFVEE